MFGSRIGTVEFFCKIEKHLEFLEGMLNVHGGKRWKGLGNKATSLCGQSIYFWMYHRHFRCNTPWTDLRNATLFQSSPLPCFLCKRVIPPSLNLDKPERESYKSSFISSSSSLPYPCPIYFYLINIFVYFSQYSPISTSVEIVPNLNFLMDFFIHIAIPYALFFSLELRELGGWYAIPLFRFWCHHCF